MRIRDRLPTQIRDFIQTLDEDVIRRFDAQMSLISNLQYSILAQDGSLDKILMEVCSDLVKALDVEAATIAVPLVDEFAPIPDDNLARQVAKVAQQRKSELLALVPDTHLVIHDGLPASLRALGCFPIVVQEQTFALLLISCRTESQALLLSTETVPYALDIAAQMGILITHFSELRSSELKWSLVELFFDSKLEPAACWKRIVERVSVFLPDWGPFLIQPAPKVQLLSYNEGDKYLRIIGTQGDEMPGTEVLVDSSICGMLVENRSTPFVVVNPREYPARYKGFLLNDANTIPQSELAVSIIHEGNMIGVLNLEHPEPNVFRHQHIEVVMAASVFLSPFLAVLRARHDKQRSQEIGILYTMNHLLTRTASTYQHLLGQPLVDMRLTLEDLEKELSDKSSKSLQMINDLRTQIDRISASSDRFCEALPRVIKYGPVNVSKAVKNALSIFNLARLEEEENIVINMEIADDIGDVYASELLQEHIYNLVNNSLYAVRKANVEDGVIRIQARRCDIRDKLSQPTASRLVELRISDNGTGVPKELEEKIGTPGVTTKENYGTGYGLSAAKEYVQSIGGTLRKENYPGKGFLVEIRLDEYQESKHMKRSEANVQQRKSSDY